MNGQSVHLKIDLSLGSGRSRGGFTWMAASGVTKYSVPGSGMNIIGECIGRWGRFTSVYLP